ncbi:MAG: hypothetical protein VXW87_02705 [Pseudomonadota bacterium]|nr:hypothetical protein [Pseudomonadota bacterium]
MTKCHQGCAVFLPSFSLLSSSSEPSKINKTNKKRSYASLYFSTNMVFFSHLIGRFSPIANAFSQIFEMLLNGILALVCIGYIAGLVMLLLRGISLGSASIVALFLLGCALPFELLNTVVQNSESQAIGKPQWIQDNPLKSQLIALISSFFGAVQYLIRNYNLVKNFGGTIVGARFIRQIRLSSGVYVNTARFSVLGGIIGFVAHILLAYGNWDKLIEQGKEDKQLSILANTVWIILGFCLVKKIGFGWGLIRFSLTVSIVMGVTHFLIRLVPFNQLTSLWRKSAVWTLPLGALLYTLVDFFNSYRIIESIGWLNPLTAALCLAFGLLSWVNVMLVWGYNMVRSTFIRSGEMVDKVYPTFVSLYYSDASVRRVLSYLKEVILCGLDLLNNQLTISMVNYVLANVVGVTVNLYVLNFCTVCYAMNRLVVLYFQSSEDSQSYVKSDSYKYTPVARSCKRVNHVIETFYEVYLSPAA